MPFYIRVLSIYGFWYPQVVGGGVVLEPIPLDSKGELYWGFLPLRS